MNNTTYQTCRPYFGPLKEESAIAFEILEKYEKPCVDAVKELREETNLSLYDCNDMLRCMYRDRELERLSAENAKLQEENTELRELVRDDLRPKYDHTLRMTPVEWQEYDDNILRRAHELGVEVD